jgi:hypothetical protein
MQVTNNPIMRAYNFLKEGYDNFHSGDEVLTEQEEQAFAKLAWSKLKLYPG